MRTILLILILASINSMKTFKEYLTEQNQQIKCDINGICKVIRDYESKGNEEKILGVYKDSKGLPTIGHGHLITKDSARIFGEVLPEETPESIQQILSGKRKLKKEQTDRVLVRDVTDRIPMVKKLAPDFENYSPELQAELASETFRGMTGKSPKAMAHLRAGRFEEAAKEYLNADEYRKSKAAGTGIAGRMDNFANALRTEASRRARSQGSPQKTT